MKYQIVKHLKSVKCKQIAVFNTIQEAKKHMESIARFVELSYMGRFPVYVDGKHTYSIQGQHEQLGIVLSLNKEDLAIF